MNRSINKRIVSCPTLASKLPKTPSTPEIHLTSSSILHRFERRQYSRYTPCVLGRSIKLSELFTSVIALGGYRFVCERRLWSDVASSLNLPTGCTNVSIGLRRIYYQLLFKLELSEYPDLSESFLAQSYTNSLIPTADHTDNEANLLPATNVERNLGIASQDGTTHATAGLFTYHSFSDFSDLMRNRNIQQDLALRSSFGRHNRNVDDYRLLNSTNPYHCDPVERRDLTELHLAELSLASGLPNEIEITLNSLLALSISSSQGTGTSTSIRLSRCSNLLNLLMASVGLYDDGSSSFLICDPVWKEQTQMDFLRFWHNMVDEPEGRVFLRPDVFFNPDPDNKSDEANVTELFAPCSQPSTSCIPSITTEEDLETSRTVLVCTILVNLVTSPTHNQQPVLGRLTEEDDDDEAELDVLIVRRRSVHCAPVASWRENARFLVCQPTALRFAFLCAYARHSGLRQLGLQLLSSLRYPMDPPVVEWPLTSVTDFPSEWTPLQLDGCRLAEVTRRFLVRCILHSPDRASLLGGLNFLTQLSSVPDKVNEISLLEGLPSSIWPRLAQLLCLPDLGVVCATLEALRSLTNMGEFACTLAWHTCVDWSELGVGCGDSPPLVLVQPLLALLTLEGQSMGSQSLHRIKLLQRTTHFVQLTSQFSHQPAHHLTTRHPHLQRSCADVRVMQPPSYHTTMERHRTHQVPYPASGNTYNVPSVVPSTLVRPVLTPPFRPPTPMHRSNSEHNPNQSVTPLSIAQFHHRPSACASTSPSLLNLLTSTANSATPNDLTAPVNVTSTGSPIKTSLSELTDRLQMPPPSLPPPSALRRSIKSGIKISSPSATTVTQVKPSQSDSISSINRNPQDDVNVPNDASMVEATDKMCNGVSVPTEPINQEHIDLKRPHGMVNGLAEKSVDSVDIPSKPATHINGLKPGLLEAAVEVLNASEKFQNGSMEMHELERVIKSKSDVQNKQHQSDNLSPYKSLNGCSDKRETNDEEEADENDDDEEEKDLNNSMKSECDNKSPRSRECSSRSSQSVDQHERNDEYEADESMVSDDLNSSSESGGSSGSENADHTLSPSKSNLYMFRSCNRYLKRKRRRGGRLRLSYIPKRRRYALDLPSSQLSPLKPLPLQLDQMPESVLGPSWKCELSSPPLFDSHNRIDESTVRSAKTIPTSTRDEKGGSSSQNIHSNHATSFSSDYLCEWDYCTYSSEDKKDISTHVYKTHLQQLSVHLGRRACRWRNCTSNSVARAPFALMTHVLDVHCSSTELDVRRIASNGRNFPHSSPSIATSSSSSFGSPSLAGLHNLCSNSPSASNAITAVGDPLGGRGDQSGWSIVRTMEMRQMQMDLWAAQHHFASAHPHIRIQLSAPSLQSHQASLPPREGPVTKHLRVTGALIIRNLVTHLEEARSWFRSELPLLSELVMGCSPCDRGLRTNDASLIIAQCLSICARHDDPPSTLPQTHIQPNPISFLQSPRFEYRPHPTGQMMNHASRRTFLYPTVPVRNVDLDS